MTTPFFSDEELQELHSLARGWAKIVSRRAFGDAGPGLDVDFRTFEQIATVAAQGLTEGTLELLLEQQADKVTDQQPSVVTKFADCMAIYTTIGLVGCSVCSSVATPNVSSTRCWSQWSICFSVSFDRARRRRDFWLAA